jgi:His-Xaa-Ser system protein HxsD
MVTSQADTWAFDPRDRVVRTVFDLGVYRLAAIQKAAYKFANQTTLRLGEIQDNHIAAAFLFPADTSEDSIRNVMRLLFEELLDQELRERIGEETHAIRALILAQAFSRTDLIGRE